MSALFMTSLPIVLRDLREWSARRGLAADEGRALHHLLGETFGKGVLQPFRLMVASRARTATLYAYGHADQDTLHRVARETGTPDAMSVLDLGRLAAKSMPETWAEGRRLAFDLRMRPVRRLRRPLAGAGRGDPGKPFDAGAEVDAFLVDALRRFPDGPPEDGAPARREEVYRTWLAERLGEAAKLETSRMVRFERTKVERRGPSEGPDVVFHGELTVTDGPAFAKKLARGVGRHTAYGYGMLLLRPAGR